MTIITIALALFFVNIFLIWYLLDTTKIYKEKEKELIQYVEQKENEKKKVFEAAAKAVGYCLIYNKKCIAAHNRTLNALKAKYAKAKELTIKRNTLDERAFKRIDKKFEKLKDEIIIEMIDTKISEVQAEELLEEAEKYANGEKRIQ